jgi:hypothetical protein
MTPWKFRSIFFWSLAVGSISAQHIQHPGLDPADWGARFAGFVLPVLFSAILFSGIVFGVNRLFCFVCSRQQP